MIFSELYSAYYNTVAAILAAAIDHPLTEKDIVRLAGKNAFGESTLTIPEALSNERWQLLQKDGTTPIANKPSMPLTLLQKRWLKAIARDPRIRLFGNINFEFPDVEPLFLPEDICVFDKYSDGDPYEDPSYIRNFRMILQAIENRQPLYIESTSRYGIPKKKVLQPERLEYSEKDDKFRVIGAGRHFGHTINLGRITNCELFSESRNLALRKRLRPQLRTVVFELVNERNALERILLHFAHFEKQAERLGKNTYRVTVHYNDEDETELVIRVLSFGPMIKVIEPSHFVDLIKQRLTDQKSCEQ